MESFEFSVDPSLRRWSRAFGVRPENCTATLSPAELTVTFGRWSLSTSPANIAAVTVTGPYRWWKVAGPPRLSLADRGITFATTAEQGVCLELCEAVGAIDPLHLIRHPNVTITVADPRRFAEEVRRAASAPAAPDAPVIPPSRPSGTLRATFRALRRWRRRDKSVTVTERAVVAIDPPEQATHGVTEGQPFEEGVGAGFHRRYRIVVNTTVSVRDAMTALQANPNLMTHEDFAPFERVAGVVGEMHVGDRYVVQLAGPWKGPVEVVDVTPNSFRLATLTGHMEAGFIDFSIVSIGAAALELTIESWARSSDAAMDLLYDRIGIAKHLQAEMWVEACEAFATAVGGRAAGPVEVITERAQRQ
jgi:hypothetical protein